MDSNPSGSDMSLSDFDDTDELAGTNELNPPTRFNKSTITIPMKDRICNLLNSKFPN